MKSLIYNQNYTKMMKTNNIYIEEKIKIVRKARLFKYQQIYYQSAIMFTCISSLILAVVSIYNFIYLTPDNHNWGWILTSVIAIIGFVIFFYLLKLKSDFWVVDYINKNPFIDINILIDDYKTAKKISRNLLLGQYYTFYIEAQGLIGIILNSDIISVTTESIQSTWFKQHFVVITDKNNDSRKIYYIKLKKAMSVANILKNHLNIF